MRIKERRRELGRKLVEIAADANVSTGYLSAIENGTTIPSLPLLARLSHALELSLAELLRTSASTRLGRGHLSDALGKRRLASEGSHLQIVRLASKPEEDGRAPVTLGDTDVFVFLYGGRLAIDVDGTEFELEPGDALHCNLPQRISWRVREDARAVSLWAASARRSTSA